MTEKTNISLAAFDIAGTLIEDTGIVVRSFSQAFKNGGIQASEEDILKLRGAAKRDVIRHFVSDGSADLVEEIYQDFRRMLEKNYEDEDTKPIPGAEDALDWMRDKGILIATTTGFYRKVRDIILEKLNWDGSFFDCNVCSDDVPKGRPAPYMIFQCMSCLNVTDVNRVIAIGDTPLDMQAGSNAGCHGVIGVLSGAHGIETLGMARHTHIITSVVSLPELIEVGI
jgi:phosphonatase-like hydrolase